VDAAVCHRYAASAVICETIAKQKSHGKGGDTGTLAAAAHDQLVVARHAPQLGNFHGVVIDNPVNPSKKNMAVANRVA
jgi:hypothetical protein